MSERLDDAGRLAALAACGSADGVARPHLDRITELVVELLGVPVSLVSLVDDEQQRFVSAVGLQGAVAETRQTPLSHSFCQYVVMSDERLVVSDARVHPVLKSNGAVSDLGVVAYCGVPIRSGSGHTLGALVAIDDRPRQWSDDHIGMLTAFAEAVSAELETDSRYRGLARDLHRRLLPDELGTAAEWEVEAIYRPLEAEVGLGGDFYDAIVTEDGSLTLVIGDIVGHDVGAAIAMGQLRAATTALTHAGNSLSEIVTTLDLSVRSMPNLFCSAWVGVRRGAGDDHVEYLAAGAIPPLLVDASGEARYLTDASTPPIGVRCERREGTAPVGPGDVLVLCSDGMMEGGHGGLDAGLARLSDVARSQRRAPVTEIVEALLADRLASGPPTDDMAALVCRLR